MRYLKGKEAAEAQGHLDSAAEAAKKATCRRDKCGSVIVKEGTVIGIGYNSPPAGREDQRRCSYDKDSYDKKVTDKTCCVHAEQRAMMDALKRSADKLVGSRIYFVRLGSDWNPARSGKPYCTICSKMALDAGIGEFVLQHDEGICVYSTEEYNTISYQYRG